MIAAELRLNSIGRIVKNQVIATPAILIALIADQFPEWRDLPVRALASQGTVNAIFRIGEELAARFPLQPEDPEETRHSLENEAEAARELSGHTRFPTPVPVALGDPGRGYPLPWSVQTWLPGDIATPTQPAGSVAFARDLQMIEGAAPRPQCLFHRMDSEDNVHCSQVYK